MRNDFANIQHLEKKCGIHGVGKYGQIISLRLWTVHPGSQKFMESLSNSSIQILEYNNVHSEALSDITAAELAGILMIFFSGKTASL